MFDNTHKKFRDVTEEEIAQSNELLRRKHEMCRRTWGTHLLLKKWIRWDGCKPDNWRSEFEIIISSLVKYCPIMFTEEQQKRSGKPEDWSVTTRAEADVFIKAVADAWIENLWLVYFQVEDEMNKAGGQNVLAVELLLEELGVDLITPFELTERLEIDTKAIGRALGAMGHERRRVGSSGPVQHIWIVGNHEKYREMRPRDLKESWQNQSEQPSFL